MHCELYYSERMMELLTVLRRKKKIINRLFFLCVFFPDDKQCGKTDEVHQRRCSLTTHYYAGTQVSGEICHYCHMCPLEARRETKPSSVVPPNPNNFREKTTTLQKASPKSSTQTNIARYM